MPSVWDYRAAPQLCALPPAFPPAGSPAELHTSPWSLTPRRVCKGPDSRARPQPPLLPSGHPFAVQSSTRALGGLGTSATVPSRPAAGRQPCSRPRGYCGHRHVSVFPAPRALRHLAAGTGQPSPQLGPPRKGAISSPRPFSRPVRSPRMRTPLLVTDVTFPEPSPCSLPQRWYSSCSRAGGAAGTRGGPHPPSAM